MVILVSTDKIVGEAWRPVFVDMRSDRNGGEDEFKHCAVMFGG